MKLSALDVLLIGIILLLGLFLIFRKPESKIIKDAAKEIALQRSYDSSQLVIKGLKDSLSSSTLVISNLDNYSLLLTEKYQSAQQELASLKSSLNGSITLVKKYNSKQLEAAINLRYADVPADTSAHAKDSIVTVLKPIASNVLQDLITYDEVKKENIQLLSIDSLQNNRLLVKDSTIIQYQKQNAEYVNIMKNQDNQRNILIQQRTDDEKQVKHYRRVATWTKVFAVAIASAVYIFK
jgi:hypothetical protein